jgi:tRNA-2-methylthio-N6-dimethylallyladenosine synthase
VIFYIKTFGCQMNEHDSEIIAGLLVSAGYEPTQEIELADLIVVNTCCVRESAENRIWGFVGNLHQYKKQKPELIIALVGCMMQQKAVQELLPRYGRHVDIVLGTYQQHRLPEYITKIQAGEKRIIDISQDNSDFPDELPVLQTNKITAQINIIYGCNNFCSYCIVPYVRGRERSRDQAAILAEIKQVAELGYKEILLLGQNVNSYGKDLPGGQPDFAELLRNAAAISGISRIRYMSSHPRDFSLELVDTIAQLPNVCHHFHLPLQNGSDKILKLMNRGYTRSQYKKLLDYIREKFDDATITTDIIVGFPGETEADFVDSLAFIESCSFDAAYTFLYSKRSGTPAAESPDQVPEQVKKERLNRLLAVQNRISKSHNDKLVGQVLPVLIEGASKTSSDMLSGRTDGNKIVVLAGDTSLSGKIVPVRITAAQTWNLIGELAE